MSLLVFTWSLEKNRNRKNIFTLLPNNQNFYLLLLSPLMLLYQKKK